MTDKVMKHPLMEGASPMDTLPGSPVPSPILSPPSRSPAPQGGTATTTGGDDDDLFSTAFPGRNDGALDRSVRRMQILHKFSLGVPMLSSILTDETDITEEQRAQMRLARLESAQGGEKNLHANQFEFIAVVEKMASDISDYWNGGERVRSVRVAIQAVKVLGHTTIPTCYPSLFVLISAVLDTFGDLVADRILETAVADSPLIAGLVAKGKEPPLDLIPATAVEIANNWFLKILSIRELLPRIYVELALCRCYKYVAKKFRIASMSALIERLGMQIRGVAEPLVAAHTRWYLFLRAAEVLPPTLGEHWAGPLMQCCLDNVKMLADLDEKHHTSKGLSRKTYFALFAPAMQWMFDVMARYSTPESCDTLVDQLVQLLETTESLHFASFMHCILTAFPATTLYARLDRITPLIDKMRWDDVPRLQLVADIAHLCAEMPAPLAGRERRAQRIELLNYMWELARADADEFPIPFLATCRALLRFCAVHMSPTQLNVMLSTVRAQTSGAAGEEEELFNIVATLAHCAPSATLLSLADNVLPVIQQLQLEQRVRVAVSVLRRVPANSGQFSSTVLELCRIVHDGTIERTPAIRLKAGLVMAHGIRAVFNNSTESHLKFLAEARHGLAESDTVKVTVIYEALRLVRLAAPHKSQRDDAKGCLAFCHVTAPGIRRLFVRIRCLEVCASVAFQFGFVAQAEAILGLAVEALHDVRQLSAGDDGLVAINDGKATRAALNLLALAVAAPPDEDSGHLHLARKLVQWIEDHHWLPGGSAARRAACGAVRLISAVRSGTLPAHFVGCPDPVGYIEERGFTLACNAAHAMAFRVLSKQLQHGAAAADVIDCCVLVVAFEMKQRAKADSIEGDSNKTTAPADSLAAAVLQRAMKLLVFGGTCEDKDDAAQRAFASVKETCIAGAKAKLGEEAWTALMEKDEMTMDFAAADPDAMAAAEAQAAEDAAREDEAANAALQGQSRSQGQEAAITETDLPSVEPLEGDLKPEAVDTEEVADDDI